MEKFVATIRIALTLVLARTFGKYEVSVWDGETHTHRYRWRGETWAFPAGPVERPERQP